MLFGIFGRFFQCRSLLLDHTPAFLLLHDHTLQPCRTAGHRPAATVGSQAARSPATQLCRHVRCGTAAGKCEMGVQSMSHTFPVQAAQQGDRPVLFLLFNHCIHSLLLGASTPCSSTPCSAGGQMMCLGGKGRSKKSHLAKAL